MTERNFNARKSVTKALFAIRGTSYPSEPWRQLFELLASSESTSSEVLDQAETAYLTAEEVALNPERTEHEDNAFELLLEAYNDALTASQNMRREEAKAWMNQWRALGSKVMSEKLQEAN